MCFGDQFHSFTAIHSYPQPNATKQRQNTAVHSAHIFYSILARSPASSPRRTLPLPHSPTRPLYSSFTPTTLFVSEPPTAGLRHPPPAVLGGRMFARPARASVLRGVDRPFPAGCPGDPGPGQRYRCVAVGGGKFYGNVLTTAGVWMLLWSMPSWRVVRTRVWMCVCLRLVVVVVACRGNHGTPGKGVQSLVWRGKRSWAIGSGLCLVSQCGTGVDVRGPFRASA